MDEQPPRNKQLVPVVGLAVVVLAATAVGFWLRGQGPATATPVGSASAAVAPSAPVVPLTPSERVHATLAAQVGALADDDEAGRLASVDGRLRSRYVQSQGRAVQTIAAPAVSEDSGDLAVTRLYVTRLYVTRLYATGHFAVGCMAEKYGETKTLDFGRTRAA